MCQLFRRWDHLNSDQLPINIAGGEASGAQDPGHCMVALENGEKADTERVTSVPPEQHQQTHVDDGPKPSTPKTLAETQILDRTSTRPDQSYDAVRSLPPTNDQRIPDPSDATEDSSAYAETLEGSKSHQDGCVRSLYCQKFEHEFGNSFEIVLQEISVDLRS
ncbi:uncharacterized protein ColSpa_11693 [Colletotrichum spaethianum]|uniref:Uncharacterized protein n=1 Tax=Colletotrichum spaethianum TaxID=700344 RepID=A0AA37URW2_9PEZI|nr:uncharacterized protein ColSpa_11693 [Colletotrichum spaethianum]GKT51512.1 hypothetical protein ColSpa_11693 [Colletotrichum spaethianum]